MGEIPTVIKAEHIGKKYIIKHNRETTASSSNLASRLLKPFKRQPKEDFWALKDISFEIKQGERVGIIGKNGAGKSTLLKLLSRITEPTQGRIELLGRASAMLEVGTGFNPELTGRENVYLNGAILGMPKAEIDAKFDQIVAFSEIGKFIDTPVKHYSSGMYVRLAFSVASHLDPDILIIDEVLAVGDQKFRQKCMDRMNEIAESNKTILVVSHQMSVVRELCDRVILLQDGNILFDGDIEEGVQKYLDLNLNMQKDMPRFIVLSERIRSDGFSQRIQMLEFSVSKKNDMCFSNEEPLQADLKWKALEDVQNVYIRIIFTFQDNTTLGMACTTEPLSAKNNEEKTTALNIDLNCFASGIYSADIYLYTTVQTEIFTWRPDNYDVIDHAFSFEINHTGNNANNLEWHHQGWGHAVLPRIIISGEHCEKN